MVAQRRYSVTGQTPPDDAEQMKARSPKLQALDTSVQTTSCGLCDGGLDAHTTSTTPSTTPNTTTAMGPPGDDSGTGTEQRRGRNMAQAGTVVRTSSKRSATQLPSPSSPSHELPPKIARFRLAHDDMILDMDMDMDLSMAVQANTDSDSDGTDDAAFASQATSLPSTPSLDQLQLCADDAADDDCMEDFALSPSHSRNHSADRFQLDEKHTLQASWAAFQKAALVLAPPQAIHLEDIQPPPLTFLTLPPEIRHQIYRNCENIVLRKPLVYCISTFDGEMQHPLASVSRLVRSEALAIFYSYNLWVIKVEFRIMYDAFQDWIIRLSDGAGLLRLVNLSVRGSLFKPKRTHTQSVMLNGQLIQVPPGAAVPGNEAELYCPPDGDASFHIDLSEKFIGGKVQLVRNDGTKEAGEKARHQLGNMVQAIWEKRRTGTLNGQDWVSLVDGFLSFVGGW